MRKAIMSQLDIEISRYEDMLLRAVLIKLPEAVIQQYNRILDQKLSQKTAQKENN